MSNLKDKIARILFGDIIGRGISFVTTIYLARVLGADSYGLVILALSFLGYATWFADLGLTNIGGREIAKEPQKRTFRVQEIFVLKIILNFSVLGLCILILPRLDLPGNQKEIILSFSFALIPIAFILEWYYNARQHFGKTAFSRIINSSIYLVLVLLFINSPGDVEKLPSFFITGAFGSAVLLGIYSIKDKSFVLPIRGWNVFKELLRSAITVGSGTFFTQMLQLLPPIVIGLFLSTSDAGLYGSAIKIIFIAMIIDRIFVQLLLPNLSSQWSENEELAKKNLSIVARIMLALGGILSLGIAISSPVIIDIIFGAEYQESAILLTVLTILLFFTFLNSLFAFGLVAIGKDKQFFNSTVLGGIIAGLLIFGTSFKGNLLHIVFAVSISEVVFTATAFYWFNKNIRLKIITPTMLTLITALLLYGASNYIHLHVLIEAVMAVFTFIPILFAFKVIRLDHLVWLKAKLFR